MNNTENRLYFYRYAITYGPLYAMLLARIQIETQNMIDLHAFRSAAFLEGIPLTSNQTFQTATNEGINRNRNRNVSREILF